jgi:NADPH-dependent 2,4-dienoyl-CoA reductase/sulfur reductase-like enzyme
MRLLVVGGSDTGISAALRARELDSSVEVTVLVADRFPNFSICGLPYHVSGDVADWRQLAHRSLQELEGTGMELRLDHTAHRIDPATRRVVVTDPHGHKHVVGYDRLIVGTGAVPARPPIPGLDLPGVHVLHSMADMFAVQQAIAARRARRALIVGAGYIGLEMAEAFTSRGLEVTVVEQAPAAMPTVDPELGQIIGQELADQGVRLATGVTVRAIHPHPPGSGWWATPGSTSPPTWSWSWSGCDPTASWPRLLAEPAYLPLGTTAHKQGRVAGENALGGQASFAGSLGTQVVKVFQLAVARTGLRDQEARAAGYDPVTVESMEFDHKAYYPDAHPLWLQVTGDRSTGQLLGAQVVGDHRAQVAKRIDISATALFHQMTVEGLGDLDLSYTPPFGSPRDAVQMAAQTWVRQVRGGQRTQAASHETQP